MKYKWKKDAFNGEGGVCLDLDEFTLFVYRAYPEDTNSFWIICLWSSTESTEFQRKYKSKKAAQKAALRILSNRVIKKAANFRKSVKELIRALEQ